MSLQTLTERAHTQVEAVGPFASETAAEAYQRHRVALKSPVPAERLAAVAAMVECGSSAVFPLLRTIEDDEDLEVATAALWSLLRLADDMLGGNHEERDTPDAIIGRGRLTEPYLRLGLEAVMARAAGGSAADTAYAWVHRLGRGSHEAGIRFLSDLVRLAPDLDPQLPDVLRRMARRHPLPWIRPNGIRLLREYEAWNATDKIPPAAALAKSLEERRLAVESEKASDATSKRLLAAATVDPDRTVRHLAGARLYCLLRKGIVGTTPRGASFKDTEVRALFLEGREGLEAHPRPAESLRRVADRSVRSRRCVLRLVTHLRPVVSAIERAELDEFVRRCMPARLEITRRQKPAAPLYLSAHLPISEAKPTPATRANHLPIRPTPHRALKLPPHETRWPRTGTASDRPLSRLRASYAARPAIPKTQLITSILSRFREIGDLCENCGSLPLIPSP